MDHAAVARVGEISRPIPTPRLRVRRKLTIVPRLSVVLVNYCQWDDTAKLVRELESSAALRDGTAEIVIVDNHSPPHPIVPELRRRPGVSMRRWGRNRGFARAVNEGCRLSQGNWLLLLNPDTTVPAGFLDDVLAVADRLAAQEPTSGLIGFQLRHSDGSRQCSSGPFPTLAGTLAGLVMPRCRRKYSRLFACKRRPVPWITGCCLLVRRDCFKSLGGLDEDFFLYYEDVDLCRRAHARGWSVWYDPAVRIIHHRPLHTRAVPAHLRVITRHGLLTYAAKHWPTWQARLLAGIVRLESWVRRGWADWHGETETADLFGQLRAIAADHFHGRPQAARDRLNRIVRRQEQRLAS
jgi:GT2 family glycosyltransferase